MASKPQALIFAPNLTGPLHVGNALVLWLTAREAWIRRIDWVVRLDDRYERDEDRNADRERATVESIRAACELLDIEPAETYRYSERCPRYVRMAHMLLERGLAHREPFGEPTETIVANGTPYHADAIHGRVRPPGSPIVLRGTPNIHLAAVCDYIDYRTPLHVRGVDLLPYMMPEVALCRLVDRLDHGGAHGAPPVYAHVPVVADRDGTPLHKGDGVPMNYVYGQWARNERDPAARRRALEALVYNGHPRVWANANRAQQVDVTPDGLVGRRHPLMRGRGMLVSEHYYRDPYHERATA